MPAPADIHSHLSSRRQAIGEFFATWSRSDVDQDRRSDALRSYLSDLGIGKVEPIGDGSAWHLTPDEPDHQRPQVLVVGRHDTADLATNNEPAATESALVGPGVASRVGPTAAFAEAAAAIRTAGRDHSPVDVHFISSGEGQNAAATIASVVSESPWVIPTNGFDAVYLTNAVAWDPFHPTQTVGSRGSLIAELRLGGVRSADDFTTSGALRNPLTTLTRIMGRLRDDRGRITLPDFYETARPPAAEERALLTGSGFDPSAWADKLRSSRPGGSLSSTERATMWPGVSVLDMACDPNGRYATPTWASATIAFYLVPDQRHVDIERSLRTWFLDAAPADLTAGVHVLESSRPYRAERDDPAVMAQRQALQDLRGPSVVAVPGGGMAGAGEIAFALNAPTAFAGIARPSNSWGSTSEGLSWSEFDAGVEIAAVTCRRLGAR